jgi:O-antigen/teichoic acid export membrane protein
LNPIKQLAGQTVIYGLSSIVGRFLTFLLVPLYTRVLEPGEYGVVTDWYSVIGFLLVILPYGMETAFFRYAKLKDNNPLVYSTALRSVGLSTSVFLALALIFSKPLAGFANYPGHEEYVVWFALILAFDTWAALPFARLRQENKALRFASVKMIELGINISLNLFFLVLCRQAWMDDPGSMLGKLYNPSFGVGYIFLANLFASAAKMLLLSPQWVKGAKGFDKALWREMMAYGLPLVLVGLAGIINEMLDRQLLKYLLPYSVEENLAQLGIYGANYKLAVFMNLFIQAFRYAAEPFFFSQSDREDAKPIYATVFKFFSLAGILVFLIISLFLDLFKYFIGPEFWGGLNLVPILLLANLFLGMVVNLSIWYKLTDKTMKGAWVAIGGAVITVVLNVWLIPIMGIAASAWATLACYFSMTVASYLLSRIYYPVNYPILRVSIYLIVALGAYFGLMYFKPLLSEWLYFLAAALVCLAFFLTALVLEGREWRRQKV